MLFVVLSGLVWIVVGMVSENRGNGQKTVQRMGAWTCKHVCIGTDFAGANDTWQKDAYRGCHTLEDISGDCFHCYHGNSDTQMWYLSYSRK